MAIDVVNNKVKERDITYDIMKGITILLVIVGHTPNIHPILRNYIYAFHMPLFFMVSGRFFHPSSIYKEYKHLIVPYIFCCLLQLWVYELTWGVDFKYVKWILKSAFWCTASSHLSPNADYIISAEIIWFLFALFWTRVIYGWLSKHISYQGVLGGVCLGLFLIAVFIDHYVAYLPFGILQGLTGLLFFYIGRMSSKWQIKLWNLIPFVVIYGITSYFCALEVDGFRYHGVLMPVLLLSAIGGAALCYLISLCIKQSNGATASIFAWLGRNSLLILLFHQIQQYTWCCISNYILIDRLIFAIGMTTLVRFTPINKLMKQIV